MSGLGEGRKDVREEEYGDGGGEKSLSDPAKWSMSKVRGAGCKSSEKRRGEESFVQRRESSIAAIERLKSNSGHYTTINRPH